MVSPLMPAGELAKVVLRLNPHFTIDGEAFVMLTEFLTTVPLSDIGPSIADLSTRADEITAATDFLFQGF